MAAGMKTGGRQKGTPNKATAARAQAAEAGPGLPLTHARTREGAASPGKPSKTGPDGAPAPQAIPASLGMSGKPAPPGDVLPINPALPPYRFVAIDKLTPYENNARVHSPAQIDMLAKMISRFGWTNPVLVDSKRGIIAGHGRVLAARKLGMDAVPTIELSHMTKAERRAYIIADNQSAVKAGWDDDLLRLELGELRDEGFDLELTGFDEAELDALFGEGGTEGLTDPDEVPELAPAISVLGDVWILGRHRLVCGDSTTPEAVDAALAGVKPHLMVTDPPYGVNYDANWRNDALQAGVGKRGAPGGRAVGKVQNDGQADWRDAWALFPGAVAYVWHGALLGGEVANSLTACRFKLRAQIVWVKPRPVISRGDYHWQHEPLLHAVKEGEDDQWRFVPDHEVAGYAVREGATGSWQGSRKQSTVWFIEHVKSETGHSTQKPVECMKRPIENNSSPGQAVYEPFSGSGTTIIAAEMTGRSCHAIELSPRYVDVAVRRWEVFTGRSATLEADGRTFATVAGERLDVAA